MKEIELPYNDMYRKITRSLDGQRVAVSAVDGTIVVISYIFDSQKQQLIVCIKPAAHTDNQKTEHTGFSPCIEFSPDGGNLLYSNETNGTVHIYTFETETTSTLQQQNQTLVKTISCNIRYPIIATACSVVNWWMFDDGLYGSQVS